jgi:hypothetical protein
MYVCMYVCMVGRLRYNDTKLHYETEETEMFAKVCVCVYLCMHVCMYVCMYGGPVEIL